MKDRTKTIALALIVLAASALTIANAQKAAPVDATSLADAVARNSAETAKAVVLIQALASRVGAVAVVNAQREYHYGPLASVPDPRGGAGRVYVLPSVPPGGVASISHVELERAAVHEGADYSFSADTLTPNVDWGDARVWVSVWGGVQ